MSDQMKEVEIYRPLPNLDSELFGPFWKAAARGELVVQECSSTGKKVWPPRFISPYDPEAELRWVPIEGKGEVYTYNVVHRAFFPYFKDKVPYAIVIVELEDGVRMLGNTREINPSDVRPGMKVKAVFEKVDGQRSLVHWIPA